MATGYVQVYYGEGRGKSSAAFGRAVRAASEGKEVYIIQFLKGKTDVELEFLKRLEPEIKFFRFEKSDAFFDKLPEEQKQEERQNIRNGINFARKVLSTGECDLLILDEVLGLVDNKIIDVEEFLSLMKLRQEETEVVLTGRVLEKELRCVASEIYHILPENDVDKI